MDDRTYVAQALLERLQQHELPLRLLAERHGAGGAAELEIALPRGVLGAVPRILASLAQELDLRVAQLYAPELERRRMVLAWGDDLGRSRFLTIDCIGDYYRGARRYLAAEALLAGSADMLFLHGLIDALERGSLDDARGEQLATLWERDPRGAKEALARFWKRPAEARLIAQAAKRGEWAPLRPGLPALRRYLRRAVRPQAGALFASLALRSRNRLQPPGASIAFLGREGGLRTSLVAQVGRDLAPLGLELFEEGAAEQRRGELRVVFEAPRGFRPADDVVAISHGERLPAMVAQAERSILAWLEGRVARRHPAALVGDIPRAARFLQYVARRPALRSLQFLFHCDIACRLRSPLLMPHPYGIVIDRDAVLGSRVTVMQQVSISNAVIDDNVVIGPGARIIGPLRIGRGVTVGANTVVTRDVPSHCTVVGANRILGSDGIDDDIVVEKRQEESHSVVNT